MQVLPSLFGFVVMVIVRPAFAALPANHPYRGGPVLDLESEVVADRFQGLDVVGLSAVKLGFVCGIRRSFEAFENVEYRALAALVQAVADRRPVVQHHIAVPEAGT